MHKLIGCGTNFILWLCFQKESPDNNFKCLLSGDSNKCGVELHNPKIDCYSVAPIFAAAGALSGRSFFAKVSSGT